jgi:hypothetical protein
VDGTPLEERHAVQSFDQAGAQIEFDSGNTLTLGENSLIIVRKLRNSMIGRRREASLVIVDGSLHAKVDPVAGMPLDLEVQAPGGSIKPSPIDATPSEFSVLAGPDGSSTLTVYGGQAEVTYRSTTTIVPANHAVVFSESKLPGVPRPLPIPPRLRKPLDDVIYTYRDAPPRIDFAWEGGEPGSQFRYRIASDRECKDVIHEEILSDRGFKHGNLQAGEYYWQISSLRGAVEGSPSRPRRLVVLQDGQSPPLLVELPKRITDNQVLLQGTVEPGSQVFIGSDFVSTNEVGEFEFALKLRNGYNVVVLQAIDTAGNTTFKYGLINAEF